MPFASRSTLEGSKDRKYLLDFSLIGMDGCRILIKLKFTK